jgi:hypothetical protein
VQFVSRSLCAFKICVHLCPSVVKHPMRIRNSCPPRLPGGRCSAIARGQQFV